MFINFGNFASLHVYSIQHNYSEDQSTCIYRESSNSTDVGSKENLTFGGRGKSEKLAKSPPTAASCSPFGSWALNKTYSNVSEGHVSEGHVSEGHLVKALKKI